VKYLVLGGKNRADSLGKPEWSQFERAVAMVVDTQSGRAESLLEYDSPEDVTSPDPDRAVSFRAGAIEDGHLYLCTQTEVLVFSYPGLQRVRYLSLPCFNDLHHVRPRKNGNLLVVSTGLDIVFEIDRSDRIVREWATAIDSGWEKFSKTKDYRRVSTTKPHISHPNYVFEDADRLWVTRFEQRDALCLDDMTSTIPIDIQRPHDGECYDGQVYFTTVDGHIVVADSNTMERKNVVDLKTIEGVKYSLGWCRGLLVVDKKRVIVGFSRIRPTRLRQNFRWVKHALRMGKTSGLRPSRIAQYDLEKRCLDWEFNLEDNGVNALFSIHHA